MSIAQQLSFKNNDIRGAQVVGAYNTNLTAGGDIYYQAARQEAHTEEIVSYFHFGTAYKAIHDKVCKSIAPNTGNYVLKSEGYERWVDGEDRESRYLACRGSLGSGKTAIVSTVIRDLHDRASSESNNLVLFAYFQYDMQELQTEDIVFASLLSQVVQAKGYASPDVVTLYEEYKPHHDVTPPYQKTIKILLSEISEFKTYLVLDALDEYSVKDYDSAQRLVAIIQKLNIKTLITSRKRIGFAGIFTSINIRAAEEDVRALIDQRLASSSESSLSRLLRENPDLKEEIISKITDNAKGMFILAHVHLECISEQMTVGAIRSLLDTLPGALDGALELTMKRINLLPEIKKTIAMEGISWVYFGKRRLKVAEICHALSFSTKIASIESKEVLHIEDVLDLCSGLIEAVIDDGEVEEVCQFNHWSTKQFFDRNWEKYFPDAPRLITEKCLSYAAAAVTQTVLRYPRWHKDTCPDAIKHIRTQYPSSEYASTYWGSHAGHPNLKEQFDFQLVRTFYLNGWLSVYVASEESKIFLDLDAQRLKSAHYLGLYLSRYGLIELIRYWKVGSDSNARDARGWQPIHFAAANGHYSVVELLLKSGVDADVQDKDGQTPLQVAADGGHYPVVQLLLENDGDPKVPLLHRAAVKGYPSVVQLLLENNGDPNVEDENGRTPLRVAADEGHHSIVQLFLGNGGNPNVKCDGGWTPLHGAADQGHLSVVQLLLENNADINAEENYGRKPLHVAAIAGHLSIVQLLLENGGDPIAQYENGRGLTPLHGAANHGHLLVVKLLLENNADINAEDKAGRKPLYVAAVAGHLSVVELLLGNGGDPNVPDKYGRTPFHAAAYSGHLSVVQLLLKSGVDTDVQDEDGQTALSVAADCGHHSIVRLLLKNDGDSKVPLLHRAAAKGYPSVVRLLLEKDGDPDVQDKHGRTPLHVAADEGHHSVVELLLENYGDPNVQDKYGRTPLHSCLIKRSSGNSKFAIVHTLLEKGANPLLQTKEGNTPLDLAIQFKQQKMLPILEEAEEWWWQALGGEGTIDDTFEQANNLGSYMNFSHVRTLSYFLEFVQRRQFEEMPWGNIFDRRRNHSRMKY